jgi:hypothetical protein
MYATSRLITAIAALAGAVAWPMMFIIALIVLRKPLGAISGHLPTLLDRITKMKIGIVETELAKVAQSSETQTENIEGAITADQVNSAVRIESEAKAIGPEALLPQLDRLCSEYDSIRRTMRPSTIRTQAMTRVVVQMRALAPTLSAHIQAYQGSGSAGSRLAAIAIMQMVPAKADIPWLVDRFGTEQPFVFYHAALALQNIANQDDLDLRAAAVAAAGQALNRLLSFKSEPDSNTVAVLQKLVNG